MTGLCRTSEKAGSMRPGATGSAETRLELWTWMAQQLPRVLHATWNCVSIRPLAGDASSATSVSCKCTSYPSLLPRGIELMVPFTKVLSFNLLYKFKRTTTLVLLEMFQVLSLSVVKRLGTSSVRCSGKLPPLQTDVCSWWISVEIMPSVMPCPQSLMTLSPWYTAAFPRPLQYASL